MAEPRASRPYMPGYGILGHDEGSGLLPWAWAVERLERSRDYWVATVCADGRPHVMPVWGVWTDDALWFSTSRSSTKAHNLLRDPRCTVTTDDADEPVVLDGIVALVDDAVGVARFAAAADAKYETSAGVEFYGDPANVLVRATPVSVFGLTESDFTGSPTRWRFDT